ncbi:MAG TPA: hypothetical protein VGK54_15495 [Chloroflexota bacterium]
MLRPYGELRADRTRRGGTAPQPGSVLLADDFQDAGAGQLPKASPNENLYHFGYQDGEYISQRISTEGTPYATVLLHGTYRDQRSVEVVEAGAIVP